MAGPALIAVAAEALVLMHDKGYRKVIIKRRDATDEYGMVQLSDIAHDIIAKDRSPERVSLYEIMIKPFVINCTFFNGIGEF